MGDVSCNWLLEKTFTETITSQDVSQVGNQISQAACLRLKLVNSLVTCMYIYSYSPSGSFYRCEQIYCDIVIECHGWFFQGTCAIMLLDCKMWMRAIKQGKES